VHVWRPPQHVRVDTALEEGSQIGIHYDPLLAKIASYGDDRETALRKLLHALRSTCILGLQTNREYLIQLLESDEFREGRATTAFLPAPHPDVVDQGCVAAALHYLTKSPLQGVSPNYRNNPYCAPMVKLRIHNRDLTVDVAQTFVSVSVLDRVGNQITLTIDGITRTYEIKQAGDEIFVHSPTTSLAITRLPRHSRPASATQRESANSPMPGQVLRVLVHEGQQVKTGDSLVVLEAMKMEQTIRTSMDGVVKSILVVKGQVVTPGQMLVQISAQENPE
jgi:propionyl-CoA carboxylase alpha chain